MSCGLHPNVCLFYNYTLKNIRLEIIACIISRIKSIPLQGNDVSKSPSVYPDLSYRFPAPTVLYLGAISPRLGSYPIYLSLWENQVACLWEHQHLLHISLLAVIVSEATLVVATAIIFRRWQKQGLNSYSTQQSIGNPLNWPATRKTIT